ncbi:hypothetical protein H8787_01495 [Streptococcus sp. NSJ-72]|uniref:hypothetical protein n=1 Tax=Streptococcus sp. NSJ-72 TaxID=2763068 RepID=UPI00165143F0|nr:hypothetical protein [Streptococcus sp. NSJ-72]QNL42573.1 hypothetical protein H8787_01495 [Streptococcus sp. NSJ-72]
MNNKIPLSRYIDEQITFFNIEDTKKNRNKLKMKFQRTLEKEGLWADAEVRLIGKKRTRVFSPAQLDILSRAVKDYLIKIANWNEVAIKEAEENSLKELHNLKLSLEDDEAKMHFEAIEKLKENFGPIQVTQSEEMYVMTKALFELFFTPINVKAWNKDRKTVYYTNPMDEEGVTTLQYLQAKERLKNPKYYFSKKPDK